ncbi:MAG: ribosome-associated translation inhibitor RaiA [Patescibacteria group bacterium]
MQITIKATNFSLTPAIESLVEEKLGGLAKYIQPLDATGVALCVVEVGKTTRHHLKGPFFRAEADVRLPGRVLRAEASEKTLLRALVTVKRELQKQIETYRGGQTAKRLRGARAAKKKNITPEAREPGEGDLSKRHWNE